MSLFDRLPNVNNCCFCISLKWGSMLIAILTLLMSLAGFFTFSQKIPCGGSYKSVMEIVGYVGIAINVLIVIASIVFIFGIIKSIPNTAVMFLYTMLLNLLASVILLVIGIVFIVMKSECSLISHIIVSVISLAIWLYFMTVVNSYKDQM